MTDEPRVIKLEKPLLITNMEIDQTALWPTLKPPLFSPVKPGGWVAVRLSGPEETETHLGIYLGDLAVGIALGTKKGAAEGETTLVVTAGRANPCMYVPKLARFVFGMESWWGAIRTPEDLRQITDQDISNVWYVRALKDLAEAEPATVN